MKTHQMILQGKPEEKPSFVQGSEAFWKPSVARSTLEGDPKKMSRASRRQRVTSTPKFVQQGSTQSILVVLSRSASFLEHMEVFLMFTVSTPKQWSAEPVKRSNGYFKSVANTSTRTLPKPTYAVSGRSLELLLQEFPTKIRAPISSRRSLAPQNNVSPPPLMESLAPQAIPACQRCTRRWLSLLSFNPPPKKKKKKKKWWPLIPSKNTTEGRHKTHMQVCAPNPGQLGIGHHPAQRSPVPCFSTLIFQDPLQSRPLQSRPLQSRVQWQNNFHEPRSKSDRRTPGWKTNSSSASGSPNIGRSPAPVFYFPKRTGHKASEKSNSFWR